MTPDERIHRYLHGLATAEERAELDRLLAGSPEIAEAFARASRLDHALDGHFRREQKVSTLQLRLGREQLRRRRMLVGAAAGLLLAAVASFLLLRGGDEMVASVLRPNGDVVELQPGDAVSGPAVLSFGGESTTFTLSAGADFVMESIHPAKRGLLKKGRLVADVAKQSRPMVVRSASADATVIGTRFIFSVDEDTTRLEVTQGKVTLDRSGEKVDVADGEVAVARPRAPLAKKSAYRERFLALYGELHDRANSYFSGDGIPYHSAETFIIDAPDHGHLTTSETFSYWLWLEAMQGRVNDDWKPFQAAWQKMEDAIIPSAQKQPNADLAGPATYAPEADRIAQYPVDFDPRVAVGPDPLLPQLSRYGADLYVMHWLLDVDNVYGYGARAFVNTFQRGPTESVWKTIPHPSIESFATRPNGFLDLFVKQKDYVKQWRYTGAPDADARAIQAAWWAARWAKEKGHDPAAILPLAKASRMGDSLRYALYDKYFKGEPHHLLSWSQAWGGTLDRENGWAWRIGGSHVHFGYQNPLAAWALAQDPRLSDAARADWSASVGRQVAFYRWLQSAEGAIAGGATSSLNGRYEAIPQGTPTFYGLPYVPHPVFLDPPSNEWFGWQVWSMGRLAQYAALSGDATARAVVDRWAAWARSVVKLDPLGGYRIPDKLSWSGRPDAWDPKAPGSNARLRVSVTDETQDVGTASALARALIAHGSPESRALARELIDRIWSLHRDERGVSNPEVRRDYAHLNDKVEFPPGWRGALASGDAIGSGSSFLDLRPGLQKDPDFRRVDQALRSGNAPTFRYHRFWAQVEFALANAELAGFSN